MKWRTTKHSNCWSTENPDSYFIAYRQKPERSERLYGIFESFSPHPYDEGMLSIGEDGTMEEAKKRCEKHHDLGLPEFVRPMSHHRE